jgi:hypothetical protein
MRKLVLLCGAIAASCLLFIGVFSVVHRPLTIGDVARHLEHKSAHARSLTSPKLVVFAGSGGRYSHRCAVITEATGQACANLSIAVGVGLDFLLEQLDPLLRRGDLVYMPLEYAEYRTTREAMDGGAQNQVLVHDMPQRLWTLPPARIARAYGSFDLPFLVHGLIEMGLQRTGFSRRTSLASLTPQGDESGHDLASSEAYGAFLRSLPPETVDIPLRSHALDVLHGFLERMRQRGVMVIGGLPATPEGTPLDARAIERLRTVYERAGHRFLVLPNRSQYPLDCFFDSLNHLNELCQLRHSALLGDALRAVMASATAP